MKAKLLIFISVFSFFLSYSQDDGRHLLRGKVLYRGSNVINENVINTTNDSATITNQDGEFAIRVKEGDELVFMALNYQLEIVTITPEILQRNRLVVEVAEKVTQLDEVVITPENQEKFLEMQNERFKEIVYERDQTNEVENIALSRTERGLQDGINFVNIFRALVGSKKKESPKINLKMSEVLRQVYDDQFFVSDLQLPQDKIDEFLYFLDDKMPAQSLLKKQNEFQLIDFLVTESNSYLKLLNAKD